MHLLRLLAFVVCALAFELTERQFAGKSLRILPLGASITYGEHSSTGNGYRAYLRNLLSSAQVSYVGNQCSGDMSNGNNEGHSGFTISQMQSVAASNVAYKPNVIIVYVGTNDMALNQLIGASSRMADLTRYLSNNFPGAFIVVSKLFLDTIPSIQASIESFNAQLSLGGIGNVEIADLSRDLTAADLADDKHPNDSGYAKMAQKFYNILVSAQASGRIPDVSGDINMNYCNGPGPAAVVPVAPAPAPTTVQQNSQVQATPAPAPSSQPASSAPQAAPETKSSTTSSSRLTTSSSAHLKTSSASGTTINIPASAQAATESGSFSSSSSLMSSFVTSTSTSTLSSSTGTRAPTSTANTTSMACSVRSFSLLAVAIASLAVLVT